jgi:NADH-quinone oxidoreductase subunit J
MEQFAFYVLAVVAIISSLGVVLMNNPVHSALFMLATFFSVAGIFVQLNAEYIAAIQILVYAGAILVLYLFVVMLLNPKYKGFIKLPIYRIVLGLVAGFVVFVQILVGLKGTNVLGKLGNITPDVMSDVGNVKLFGEALFTRYLVPFEVASILLLVALIGAIVIAKKN